jgi:hypothetical protein
MDAPAYPIGGFENKNVDSGIAQFQRGVEPGKPGPHNNHISVLALYLNGRFLCRWHFNTPILLCAHQPAG